MSLTYLYNKLENMDTREQYSYIKNAGRFSRILLYNKDTKYVQGVLSFMLRKE